MSVVVRPALCQEPGCEHRLAPVCPAAEQALQESLAAVSEGFCPFCHGRLDAERCCYAHERHRIRWTPYVEPDGHRSLFVESDLLGPPG